MSFFVILSVASLRFRLAAILLTQNFDFGHSSFAQNDKATRSRTRRARHILGI